MWNLKEIETYSRKNNLIIKGVAEMGPNFIFLNVKYIFMKKNVYTYHMKTLG